MANVEFGYDPAYVKLTEVKKEAVSLGLPESIVMGLQTVMDLYKRREVFCEKMTTQPSDTVLTIIKETMEHPWEQAFKEGKTKWKISVKMLSGHIEGDILKFLVSSSRAKRVLEVGMFTGCAALGMAEVLPEDGKLNTCEFDPYLVKLARSLFDKSPHGKKIEILEGLALETMTTLANNGEKFDFIFVDAMKKEYIDYCKLSLNSLLAPGGTIAVDNALMSGQPYKDGTSPDEPLTKFNEWVLTRSDICHVLLPVRDGIMLIRRKEDMNGGTQ